MLLALPLLLLTAAPDARLKVLVMPLAAGEGVTEGTAKAIGSAELGEIRKRAGLTALAGDDIQAVLSVERQRQLMGCSESNCIAELGGAMGVGQVVTGSVARLGESWLIHLQVVDAKKATVLRESDRRKKKGTVDDVLDELPSMVGELFGAAGPQPPPVALPSPNPAPQPTPTVAQAEVKLPPPGVDELDSPTAEVRKGLRVLADGHGHFLALVPFKGFDGPFYAGSAESLNAQYIVGGGSQGNTEFSVTFWEPRVRAGAESELEFRDGKYALTCGAHTVPFTELDAKATAAFLAKAKLKKPRWRRRGIALGRDDDGNYYYVDAPREDGRSDDLHLFIGRKGQVVPAKVTDAQREPAALLVESDAGTLKLPLGEGDALKTPGSFKSGSASKPVTALDLWSNRGMIYTALGAYAGERIGTACDPFLP